MRLEAELEELENRITTGEMRSFQLRYRVLSRTSSVSDPHSFNPDSDPT
jgi:hypothetical protein